MIYSLLILNKAICNELKWSFFYYWMIRLKKKSLLCQIACFFAYLIILFLVSITSDFSLSSQWMKPKFFHKHRFDFKILSPKPITVLFKLGKHFWQFKLNLSFIYRQLEWHIKLFICRGNKSNFLRLSVKTWNCFLLALITG